jgi:hypothetical protein
LSVSKLRWCLVQVKPQELRDDSFISTDNRYDERYQAMVQQDEMEGYQQDQDQQEEEKSFDESDGEIEVRWAR